MEKLLPALPAKRYFTIGEVSELCGVKPYVLRYWEQEFTQLKPMKRRGNRRYYQHHEVLLIRRIRDLLYDQGFTISGARNQLVDPVTGGRAASAHATARADGLDDGFDDGFDNGSLGDSEATRVAAPDPKLSAPAALALAPSQLRPMKRRGNRRYYQHHEVLMIRRIRDLLYDQGFTISGARNKLQEIVQTERDKRRNGEVMLDGVDVVEAGDTSLDDFGDSADFEDSAPDIAHLPDSRAAQQRLQLVRRELFEIRDLLSASY